MLKKKTKITTRPKPLSRGDKAALRRILQKARAFKAYYAATPRKSR